MSGVAKPMEDHSVVREQVSPVTGWRTALVALTISLLFLFAAYWQTFFSMASIWWRSETFAHGMLIFPISLYLIWKRRDVLASLAPQPDWRGLIVLFGLGFGWLLANVVDVLVIQQLCFIAMILVLVWTYLGWRIAWEIAFPLGFLFFAVPIGEFLVPPLMNFTADFTVKLIELTGIPIYREGTFFSIPSGDWSVVEGCSGLRYLIASLTLGCLYAYLTYRTLWRRLLFIALSVGFPIIANGLRAFMIVMIAHYSDMRLALGVDHYIYGWVFFGLVMLLMFWIGSLWKEPEWKEEDASQANSRVQTGAMSKNALIVLALATALMLAIWPVRAMQIREKSMADFTKVTLSLPEGTAGWHRMNEKMTPWEPRYLYPDAKAVATYSNGTQKVTLFVLYYRTQVQDKELVNSQNILVPQKHPVWMMPGESKIPVKLDNQTITVRQGRVQSSFQKLLVWRWNWVSDTFTANDYLAKLLEAKDKVLGRSKDAAGIVVAVEYDDSVGPAEKTLHQFLAAMLPEIEQTLQNVAKTR
ncbi:MAG: hypothetical protein AXA67_05360 [Methylothermaceae bacteria B42]|nr:MAG: hypothetical protein AXA67_05360 [Methylothermaceae bacteria B42]